MDLQNKSKRSVNFSQTEELLLVNLAKKYKHILENKKTDAVTNKDKATVWLSIEK